MFIYIAVEPTNAEAEAESESETESNVAFGTCIDAAGETYTFTTADAMVTFLQNTPGTFVTFDGAQTDLRLLAAAASDGFLTDWVTTHVTSINHIDIHEAFVLEFGYPTLLSSFPAAVGTTKVEQIRALHASACSTGFAIRKTAAGKPQTWLMPATGMRSTVDAQAQAVQFPPDQSWMSTPFDVTSLWAWAAA